MSDTRVLADVSAETSDEELVARARAGDDAALEAVLQRYRRLARARACAYFLVGGDHEDLVQEAMIGLFRAVTDFDADLQVGFPAFAELCVARQLVSAIRAATRRKHGPLNDYVSFHRPVLVDGDGHRTLGELLPAGTLADPAEQLACRERIRALHDHVDATFSDLEAQVLRLHIDGVRHREIARRLCRRPKSVDNALQRVRRKLDEHLAEHWTEHWPEHWGRAPGRA